MLAIVINDTAREAIRRVNVAGAPREIRVAAGGIALVLFDRTTGEVRQSLATTPSLSVWGRLSSLPPAGFESPPVHQESRVSRHSEPAEPRGRLGGWSGVARRRVSS